MTTATIGPFTFELEMLKGDKGDVGPAGMGSSIPGGRPTLVSGLPDMPQNADYSSATLFYAPFIGDTVPIFDGTNWQSIPFTSGPLDQVGLSMTGGPKWTANARRDVFVIVVEGVAVLATGPAWPSDSLASRKLIRRNGLWVNSEVMTLDTSATESLSVAANCATWVGSIEPTGTGTLTATFTPGQNRRCDVWSVYHQREILLTVCQPPVSGVVTSWKPDTQYPTFKAFNNNANNKGRYFTGLPQNIDVEWFQRGFVDSLNFGISGVFWAICKNSLSNYVGTWGSASSDTANTADGFSGVAVFFDKGSVGAHDVIMGTAKAGALGCTLWGVHPPPYGQTAQTMNIRYMG